MQIFEWVDKRGKTEVFLSGSDLDHPAHNAISSR